MFVIYGHDSCGYCTRAKELLTQNGLSYEDRNVMTNMEFRQELKKLLPNATKVPQIFLGDKHIGGFTELQAGFANGSIKAQLDFQKLIMSSEYGENPVDKVSEPA